MKSLVSFTLEQVHNTKGSIDYIEHRMTEDLSDKNDLFE